MFILKFTSVIFLAIILAACSQESKQDAANQTADEQATLQVAKNWLALVDESKHGSSWDEAAEVFKRAISRPEWEEMLGRTRSPLGKVLDRNVNSKSYETSLAGVLDGEYVVIQFQTKYEHKANTIETVTPSKGKDGNWRVAGYYIK